MPDTRKKRARRKAMFARHALKEFEGKTRSHKRLGSKLEPGGAFDQAAQHVKSPTIGQGGLKPMSASGWENAQNKRGGLAHDRGSDGVHRCGNYARIVNEYHNRKRREQD